MGKAQVGHHQSLPVFFSLTFCKSNMSTHISFSPSLSHNSLSNKQTNQNKGGCPRQNRAIAAKLVYPDLTIREALLLAGFDDEELDSVKDPKHTWRTGYVYYKDQILKKVDKYPTARKTGARISIEKLVDILQGEEENRFEQVFGESSSLLSGFLEAAEERRRNGIVEQPRRKRKINDV